MARIQKPVRVFYFTPQTGGKQKLLQPLTRHREWSVRRCFSSTYREQCSSVLIFSSVTSSLYLYTLDQVTNSTNSFAMAKIHANTTVNTTPTDELAKLSPCATVLHCGTARLFMFVHTGFLINMTGTALSPHRKKVPGSSLMANWGLACTQAQWEEGMFFSYLCGLPC